MAGISQHDGFPLDFHSCVLKMSEECLISKGNWEFRGPKHIQYQYETHPIHGDQSMKKGWWTWSVFMVNGRKQSKPANLVAPPDLCLQWQRANAWQLNFHGFQQRHTLHMANSQACHGWRMIGFSLKRNESSCEKLCLQPWEKTWTLPLLNKSQALNQLLHKCPSLCLTLLLSSFCQCMPPALHADETTSI